MNNQIPKVSVIMSVYNGYAYLGESIDSILNQTFVDFEFIIIDDCSTDKSAEVIFDYASKDQRIVVVKNQENIGLTKSLNKGLQLAKSQYIARQDADDVSLPSRLEKEVSLLEKHPEIGLVSCNIDVINSVGNYTGKHKRDCIPELVSWYLLFYNHLAGHSQVMFRRQLAIDLEGYDESRRYSQDYELWSRLMFISKIAILPEFLLKQRRHSASISVSKTAEQKKYSLAQSQYNIKQIIGKEITLEEVQHLRSFWLGNWKRKRFPEIKNIAKLNSNLLEIYQKFVQQENINDDIAKQIRILIGKQFHYWIQAPLTIKHGLLAKFKISSFASAWHSSEISFSWLKLFWNTGLNVLEIISEPIHRKKTGK